LKIPLECGVSRIYNWKHVWYWKEGLREEMAEEGKMLLMIDMNSVLENILTDRDF